MGRNPYIEYLRKQQYRTTDYDSFLFILRSRLFRWTGSEDCFSWNEKQMVEFLITEGFVGRDEKENERK